MDISQANDPGVPYRYPDSISSDIQTLSITGQPDRRDFHALDRGAVAGGTTAAIPYTATVLEVQTALAAIVGAGNVVVSGVLARPLTITFQGASAGEAHPDLTATSNLTGGTNPSVAIATASWAGCPWPRR